MLIYNLYIRMKIRELIIGYGITCIALLASSCESIYDTVQGCGLFVNFKYDYNMLYADAFHSQVERVDVYVFDRDSNFLFRQVAEGPQLKDKNYRMLLNIPVSQKEDYIVMAWAGSVDNFSIEPQNENPHTIKELRLRMKQSQPGGNNTDLGSLWYGEIKSLNYLAEDEQTETINLIKNTNRFRVLLQKVGEGESISVDDLSFRLLTDNSCYNYKNEIVSTDEVAYQPYYAANVQTVGAVAELNSMRLVVDNPLTFIIYDNKQQKDLLNIDLMKYLLAIQMEGHRMTAQEYLDRQSEFSIILFYTNTEQGTFLSSKIVVNDWTMWMHGSDLFNQHIN